MADRDAVLRDLSDISTYLYIAGIGDNKKTFDGWCRAVQDARELIKEQEPVAPKEMDVQPILMEYCCGACGYQVGVESAIRENVGYKYAYCPECGKKVLWDG